MVIVFIGPPCSGKGTISNIFLNKYKNFIHISPGEILLEESKNNPEIKKIMESGNLITDKIVSRLMIDKMKKKIDYNFVLDGYPRSLEQVNSLENIVIKLNLKLKRVFNFNISYKELVIRIKNRRICSKCKRTYSLTNDLFKKRGFCNFDNQKLIIRKDDDLKIFSKRIKIYNEAAQKIINFYKNKNIFYEINVKDKNFWEKLENEIFN